MFFFKTFEISIIMSLVKAKAIILDTILPQVLRETRFKRFIETNKVSPVVLGGVNYTRCIERKQSQYSGDVDLKFILEDAVNNDETDNPTLLKIHRFRMRFLKRIQSILKEDYGIETVLRVPEVSRQPINTFTWRVELLLPPIQKKQVLMDTGIWTNFNKPHLKSFSKTFSGLGKTLVPMTTLNGINYPTCEWNFLDLVRMIEESLQVCIAKGNDPFWTSKLDKYMERFASSYAILKKENKKASEFKHVFEETKNRVKGVKLYSKLFKNDPAYLGFKKMKL
jgi:hypothetical protein